MARERSFNFIPLISSVSSPEAVKAKRHVVTINIKHKTLTFSKPYIKDKMLDGQYIKFFYDISKKAIGWKVLRQVEGFDKMKQYKKIKLSSSGDGGVYLMYLGTSLEIAAKQMHLTSVSYKYLPIEEYKTQGVLNDGTFEYVICSSMKTYDNKKTNNETTSDSL